MRAVTLYLFSLKIHWLTPYSSRGVSYFNFHVNHAPCTFLAIQSSITSTCQANRELINWGHGKIFFSHHRRKVMRFRRVISSTSLMKYIWGFKDVFFTGIFVSVWNELLVFDDKGNKYKTQVAQPRHLGFIWLDKKCVLVC